MTIKSVLWKNPNGNWSWRSTRRSEEFHSGYKTKAEAELARKAFLLKNAPTIQEWSLKHNKFVPFKVLGGED